jgi:hypothetical protein
MAMRGERDQWADCTLIVVSNWLITGRLHLKCNKDGVKPIKAVIAVKTAVAAMGATALRAKGSEG